MVYTIKFRKKTFLSVQKHLPCVCECVCGVEEGKLRFFFFEGWNISGFFVFSGGGRTLTETVGILFVPKFQILDGH